MPKLPPPINLRAGIKKTPLDITIEPGVGWFGFLQKVKNKWLPVLRWTHCRDIFQDVSGSDLVAKGMWYCYGRCGTAENVCAFIDRVEEKINIIERSIFKKTPYPEILWIKPSPFWVHDFVRRSFFTLCLRCGMRYKRSKDNFDYCMYQHYQISRDTKPAIKRFLSGCTFYPYEDPEFNTMGWRHLFHDYGVGPIDSPELDKLLVRGW